MVLRLNNKIIDLKPNRTFIITENNKILEGTYVKSVLDTNKFIATFKTNDKKFLMYFDLDNSIVAGEDIGVQKLQSFSKQSFKNILRNIFGNFVSIIKRFRKI